MKKEEEAATKTPDDQPSAAAAQETVDLPSRMPEWPAIRAVLSAPVMEPPPGLVEAQLRALPPESADGAPVVPTRSFPLVYAINAIDQIVTHKVPVSKTPDAAQEAPEGKEQAQEAPPQVPVVNRCRTLVHVVDELLSAEEAAQLVPGLFRLALGLEAQFPGGTVATLPTGRAGVVALTRAQVACLLAHAFFGTFGAVPGAWDFQFLTLAGAPPAAGCGIYHGIVRYFLHVLAADAAGAPLTGTVRVVRAVLPGADSAAALRAAVAGIAALRAQPLCAVVVDDATRIEDVGGGALHADFANRHLGGGVLAGGCVQEEIRFGLASPELLAGLLVARDAMADHEALVLCGTELVSRYAGYGARVAWAAPYRDATPRAPDGSLASAVVAVDALMAPDAQFARACVDRDLAKAYAGFSFPYARDHPLAGLAARDVATGKWGCGVFGGDPEMKFLEQWLAVSAGARGRRLVFCTFGDRTGLPAHVRAIVAACRGMTVAQLYARVVAYADARTRAARDHQRRLERCRAENARRLAAHRDAVDAAERNGTPAPPRPALCDIPAAPELDFVSFLKDKPSSCFIT